MGDRWCIDYAWAGPPVDQIARAGYIAAYRYLSGGASGKDLKPVERDALRAAGIGIGLVWETTASRAGQGAAAGQADGPRANAQADRLGFPRDVPLYAAVDFDATNMRPIVDYFAAFGQAGPRLVRPYGSANVLDAVCGSGRPKVGTLGWQTVAWSRGRISVHACLHQLVARPVPGVTGDHDDNRVLKDDIGAWMPATAQAQPAPNPTEEDMFSDTDRTRLERLTAVTEQLLLEQGKERPTLAQTGGQGPVYLVLDGAVKVYVSTPEHLGRLTGLYGDIVQSTATELDALPLIGPGPT